MPLTPTDITQIDTLIAAAIRAARIKISELPAAGSISRSAVSPWVSSGSTVKLPMSELLALAETTVLTGQDLRNMETSTLVDQSLFANLGVATPNDGGGGLWVYDADSVASDNVGTVIAPDTGVGRFIRLYSGALNVRWFNARGNGTTDDTVAIQLAITAATGAGPEVFLPTGNYVISEQLLINTSNLRFFGSGTLTASASYNTVPFGGMITVSTTGDTVISGVTIEGITIYGTAKETYGIYLYGKGFHSVLRCYISNFAATAIGGSSITRDCLIQGNFIQLVGTIAYSAINVVGSRCKMIGNTLKNCLGKGIVLGADLSVAVGNTISYDPGTAQVTGDGIYIQDDASNATVTGNTIESAMGNGIKSTEGTSRTTITGNTIYMANGAGYGIFLQGATQCTVTGNTIVMVNNHAGIYLGRIGTDYATDNLISHNVIRGIISSNTTDPNIEANSGILVYDSAADNTITGNNISTFTLGIEVSFANRTKVKGNDIKGCVNGIDTGSSLSVEIDANSVISSGRGIYVRAGCNKTKLTNNYVLSHSIQCLNVYELQSNIVITGNTFVYDGIDAVNAVFLNDLDNIIYSGNIFSGPTSVANSVYIGTPLNCVVVGNICSGKAINVDTPTTCQVANNVFATYIP